MTQEEKQILLEDLSARLPYGVKLLYNSNSIANIKDRVEILRGITVGYTILFETDYIHAVYESTIGSYEHFKPYLRPMSSMTEEEMGEYAKFKLSYDDVYEFTDFRATGKGFINVHTSCKNGGVGYTFQVNNRTMLYDGVIGIDWLNAHHFDYRGLIGMGLALEAPEGMYND